MACRRAQELGVGEDGETGCRRRSDRLLPGARARVDRRAPCSDPPPASGRGLFCPLASGTALSPLSCLRTGRASSRRGDAAATPARVRKAELHQLLEFGQHP
ncbi:unnamed protein product [Prorocentrum cordatum]|uniref:Uncharacterized protein n=1 Tax=Prorocentrum cordatum TaxID=2364126 RepID=A0ABN9RN50_9DINO|nr:unnamed protein product [Polarella glacialis]